MGTTTIQVSEEIADELADRKGRGETYDDVLRDLIQQADALDDAADAGPEPDRTAHDTPSTRERTRGRTAPSDDNVKIDVPGSGQTADARRQAVLDMRDRLRELGSAEKSDMLEVVDADDVGYASKESFWSNVVKGRDSLKSLDGVESPAEGGRTWRWTGD